MAILTGLISYIYFKAGLFCLRFVLEKTDSQDKFVFCLQIYTVNTKLKRVYLFANIE